MLKDRLIANIGRQIEKHVKTADWSGSWWKQLANLADTEARLLAL